MIRRPAGWTCEVMACRTVLSHRVGTLIYRERVTPLARLGDILAHHAAAWDADRWECIGKPTPFVTAEGEYGALVRIDSIRGGVPLASSIAVVFGDDCYCYLEGTTTPEHAEHLRAVVYEVAGSVVLELGARTRRYLHRPPRWHGLAIGRGIAHYMPDAYPRFDARLTVYPARPLAPERDLVLDLQHAVGEHVLSAAPGPHGGFEPTHAEPPASYTAPTGLTGEHHRIDGRSSTSEVIRDIVVLRDERFAYAVELVTASSLSVEERREATDELLRVASSIQPLPQPAAERVDTRSLSHWAE